MNSLFVDYTSFENAIFEQVAQELYPFIPIDRLSDEQIAFIWWYLYGED